LQEEAKKVIDKIKARGEKAERKKKATINMLVQTVV
jgi:hypothetical protein